jgi:BirA family biotin operon repressor/biotin-[acetyl-CoA-carboxylase] ligase
MGAGLDATDIEARLGGPWREVRVLEHTPSTNADVAAAARDGAAEGLVVVTQDQTAGRGRLDRSWQSPAGAGLAVSVLLRPDAVAGRRWPWLPLLTGVAVRTALREVAGLDVTLKWPNDVLVGGRKIAGILLERVDTTAGPAAVVGVGLNVAMSPEQLPVPEATSLAVEGADVDPAELLVVLLTRFAQSYGGWTAAAGDPAAGLRDEYVAACGTIGAAVRVSMPDGTDTTGTATGVDDSGRLEVDTGDATLVVGAGDVVHLRPAT